VTTAAHERLRELHRGRELVASYPEVRALLAELPGERLGWAGQLLARLDPDEVLAAHPDVAAVTVAVTGHGTLSPLVPALTAELARHGLLLRPVTSSFDSYVADLSDPGSALSGANADLTLCVLDPMIVFDEVPVPWSADDAAKTLAGKVQLLDWLAGQAGEHGRGTLVYNTLPLPRRFAAQLVDHRSRARLGAAWRTGNADLLALAERHPRLVVLDLDPLLADGVGADDARLSVYAKAHLRPELLAAYARQVAHLARHQLGRTKKVLALDLDGTVWGGVLGDDGPDGIEVAGGYRGDAFQAFQRTVRQLGSQGVLVTAVSKNDLEPVREVLRTHPELALREEDFVRVSANWEPKPGNLRETAAVLNVGLDSFVFVDDSAYECGLVRRELPEVAVVAVGDDPAWHVARLLADGWFDAREVTADDRARPGRYRDESTRADFLRSSQSLDDYLRELGVVVRFGPARPRDLGRLSQLTLRTNQFNLTTDRLQPAELDAVVADPRRAVHAIRAADRFGDNGIVGAVFTRREDDGVHIDNFLLSCRVFSRGIEQACLAAVLRAARDGGAAAVHGIYRPTKKNAGVRDFLPRHGFLAVHEDEAATTYRHNLAELPEVPQHVRLIEDEEESPQ
jgi:FkbH-like protein